MVIWISLNGGFALFNVVQYDTCAAPRFFVRWGWGVQVSLTKKLWRFFLCLFFQSSAYFTEVKWSISKKSIIFKVLGGGGSNIFQGGVQLFPGGVQLLIPYRNPYNLWFSRGGVRTPCPPLWIRPCDSFTLLQFVVKGYCNFLVNSEQIL